MVVDLKSKSIRIILKEVKNFEEPFTNIDFLQQTLSSSLPYVLDSIYLCRINQGNSKIIILWIFFDYWSLWDREEDLEQESFDSLRKELTQQESWGIFRNFELKLLEVSSEEIHQNFEATLDLPFVWNAELIYRKLKKTSLK